MPSASKSKNDIVEGDQLASPPAETVALVVCIVKPDTAHSLHCGAGVADQTLRAFQAVALAQPQTSARLIRPCPLSGGEGFVTVSHRCL